MVAEASRPAAEEAPQRIAPAVSARVRDLAPAKITQVLEFGRRFLDASDYRHIADFDETTFDQLLW